MDRVGGAENESSWNTIFSSFPFFGESLYFLRSHVRPSGSLYYEEVRFAKFGRKKKRCFF